MSDETAAVCSILMTQTYLVERFQENVRQKNKK